jgi:TRAP-type transport system small permease protein
MAALDQFLGRLLRAIAIASFIALFVLITINVSLRFLPFTSMVWTDEVIELLFAWTVFFGSAALWRERLHFRADMLLIALGRGPSRILSEALLQLLNIAFFVVFTWLGLQLWLSASDLSPILELPRRIWYAPMPLAGLIMLVYSLRDLWALARGQIPEPEPQ